MKTLSKVLGLGLVLSSLSAFASESKAPAAPKAEVKVEEKAGETVTEVKTEKTEKVATKKHKGKKKAE